MSAKTWTEPGRGRKQCMNPKCGVYIGVRSKSCPVCSFAFPPPDRKSRPERKQRSKGDGPSRAEVARQRTGTTLLAGAGRCPVELPSSSMGDVQAWILGLQDRYRGSHLSKSALRLWSRSFFPYGSPEYLEVRDHIDTLVSIPV